MLAGLYVVYVIIYAKIKPSIAPPLSAEDQYVPLPKFAEVITKIGSSNVMLGLIGAIKGKRNADVPMRTLINHLVIALLPALAVALLMGSIYLAVTAPDYVVPSELQEMGFAAEDEEGNAETGDVEDAEEAGGLQAPPVETVPGAQTAAESPKALSEAKPATPPAAEAAPAERKPVPTAYWITLGLFTAGLAVLYAIFTFVRLEIFKMLLASFFPLALLIIGVLGSILIGLATPSEAAAMGSFGGFVLAIAYGRFNMTMLKEAVFLCAKTSAMVCWLFVGSGIFAAAFALLGGQEIINAWVQSLDMSPVQFMLLAQVIIFLLGWPLEWTEIIIIFLPIFLPLLAQFNIDPLFFGLLVALNLQTAFLSPPVAMAAFYLKGVSPPHVTLNQIFLGMMPFMAIQVLAIFLLYMFPAIGLWLPSLVYGR
jgi:TRAP-type mannitol/chloroaromatic compound transport system permease large subunit